MSLYDAASAAVERTGYGSRYDRIFDMFHPIDGRIPAVCYKRLLETVNISGDEKDQLVSVAGDILAQDDSPTSFTITAWRAALLLANVVQDGLPLDPATVANVDTLSSMDFVEGENGSSINVSINVSDTNRSQTPLFDGDSVISTDTRPGTWNPEEQEQVMSSQVMSSQVLGSSHQAMSHHGGAQTLSHHSSPAMSSSQAMTDDTLDPHALVPQSQIWEPKARRNFTPNTPNTASLAIVAEREGMFLFRHVNYSITADSVTVIRRYSDFSWLQDYLLKKYCFRQVPVLPPKRLAVNGHYLSSDNYFLERRRRGLARFINQVLRHPILGDDDAVKTFISLRNDISGWKKSVLSAAREEFHGLTIDPKFVQQWNDQEAVSLWTGLVSELDRAHESLVQVCVLLDRVAKRQEAQALDEAKIAYNLGAALPPSTRVLYAANEDGATQQINRGLSRTSARIETDCQLQQDESRGSQVGVLEEAKKYREALGSMRELFDRYQKYGGNNIPLLEKRISQNQGRLTLARQRKALMSEIEKLDRAIKMDTEMIAAHTNRTWLIRESISEEIVLFQKTQLQISKLLQEFAVDKIKYAELYSDNWAKLDNDVMDLPV